MTATLDPLLTRLALDWDALERACDQPQMPCWCCSPRCWCADVGTPEACLERLLSGDDLLALRLLAAARHGDTAAARVVLQALLPRLELAVGSGPGLGSCLGAAWEQVLRHRPRSTAHVLDHLARAAYRGPSRAIELPSGRLDQALAGTEADRVRWLDEGPRPAVELAREVVGEAFVRGVIDSDVAELLVEVYVDGRRLESVAGARGVTTGMVRERCRRAVQRMERHHRVDPFDAA